MHETPHFMCNRSFHPRGSPRDGSHGASDFSDGRMRHMGTRLLAQGHRAGVRYNQNGTSGSPKVKLTSIGAGAHSDHRCLRFRVPVRLARGRVQKAARTEPRSGLDRSHRGEGG